MNDVTRILAAVDPEAAHARYEQAAGWMEERGLDDPVLTQLRDETSGMLEINLREPDP